jgi:two-component system, NtrC family, sensor histidine kinase HydH
MGEPPGHGTLAKAAGRLSHEIRNSLAGVAGAIDVLEDRIPPAAGVEEVLDRIHAEVTRIEGWVTELALFAEPTVPFLQKRDVHEVIERALRRAPPVAKTQVARRYGREVPETHLDEKLLTEALSRLFLNAHQAMPSGGTLEIVTSVRDQVVQITIRDTGPGIGAAELAAVFEPFYSNKTRGLGLGLAIARRLVEAQGGSVALTSSPGTGAELTISLPAR